MPNPIDGGNDNNPYRDNPLLKELNAAKKELEQSKVNLAYWKEKADSWSNTYDQKIDEIRSHELMKSYIKFFLWGLVVPTWFLLTLAALVFPFYAVFAKHAEAIWFLLSVFGIASAICLFWYLDENST